MRRLALIGTIILICLLVVEVASAITAYVLPNFFNEFSVARLKEFSDFEAYQKFIRSNYDKRSGWVNPRATSVKDQDCLGRTVTYTLDASGARVTPLYGPVKIVVAGDSFTFGHDVDDDEAYPSRLAEILNTTVANLGVSGFGPVQALFHLENNLPFFPQAEVIILSIMYENIRRMRNSYRPALNAYTAGQFRFKPYIRIEQRSKASMVEIRENPNGQIAATPNELRERVEYYLSNDYYAREHRYFPYTLAILRNMLRPSQQFRIRGKFNYRMGHGKFWAEYHDSEFQAGMLKLADRFLSLARRYQVDSKIFFLPDTWQGLDTPDHLIDRINKEIKPAFATNVGKMNLNASEYRLTSTCSHPSAAGYAAIASFIAKELRKGRWR